MLNWSTGHGPGFKFVDNFEHIDNKTGVATFFLDKNSEYLKHHFPKKPILPAVFLIESAAQAAGILWSKTNKKFFNKNIYGIAGVEKFNFYKFVLPEETVTLKIEFLSSINKLGRFKITCTVNEKNVAQGIILMAKLDNIL
jgi:3-hydroxyacyl-[acyl-carrier-protein] dehydratase